MYGFRGVTYVARLAAGVTSLFGSGSTHKKQKAKQGVATRLVGSFFVFDPLKWSGGVLLAVVIFSTVLPPAPPHIKKQSKRYLIL